MAQSDDLRAKLIDWLQDAYAMEHQIAQTLEGQVKDTERYPQIQARIQQHLDETHMHEQRMEDRLNAFETKPSGMQSVGAKVMGSLMGAAGGARSDPLVKMARDDYMVEHMEIAAYGALIAAAQAYGDVETIQAARANLRDEWTMASWLEHHLADAVLYQFQEDGINLDQSVTPTVQSAVMQSMRQTSSGSGDTTGANAGRANGIPGTLNTPIAMPPATGMGRNPDRLSQSERTLNASGDETDTSINYPSEQAGMDLGPDHPLDQP
jgi:ferritin-like metal-binding protein YciE